METKHDFPTLDHRSARMILEVRSNLLSQRFGNVHRHTRIVDCDARVHNDEEGWETFRFPNRNGTRVLLIVDDVYLRVLLGRNSQVTGSYPRYTPDMIRRILLVMVALTTLSFSQDAPKAQEYVSAQFGADFVYLDRFPVLTGDLDGDGTEDAIIVTTRKGNPLVDEEEFNYKVIDPYDEYFGWGDPRVTTTFNAHDPQQVKYILIIHDWRATAPKAKLVVINLPFEKLSITRIPTKKKKNKKVVTAVSAEDLGGMTSAIFWDGKKYRWSSMSGMD